MIERKNIPVYVPRPDYIDAIRPFMGTSLIKVLTGQRRVGKSYILFHLIDEVLQKNKNAEILYINKELQEFRTITDGEELYEYVISRLNPIEPNFLFIDEIQEIEGFERALRSLLAEGKCDIYCTGSNAQLLSGELSTFLGGRYIEIKIHPLSYTEFLRFHVLDDSRINMQKYLRFGGLPYLAAIGLSELTAFEYLENVQSSILLKDVVAREKIRNVAFLKTLLEYLADNVGNLFSANNISKYLKSQRIAMPVQTILNYLSALQNAFIVTGVSRTEVNGLKMFEIGEKYYFEDLGLRNATRGQSTPLEMGKLVENAVYLHLVQQGFSVHIGWLEGLEIDFVAEKAGTKIYVQASYLIVDETTATREFGNLLKIEDNFPKYVVSFDEVFENSGYKGIKHMRLNDFLLLDLTRQAGIH